jgi:SAM-dependent methyltransferase
MTASCPRCGGEASRLFTTRDRNRRVSDEPFSYDRCRECGLIFLENVPDDLGRFYSDDYFTLPPLEMLRRAAEKEAYRLDFVRPHVPTGRIVEVGAGAGLFALLAKEAGYDYAGIEMDPDCCRYLRGTVGVEAIESGEPERALRELPPSDAVVMWHALEHLPDPWACLRAAAENLRPGGVLVAAVPNPDAFQFKLMKARWPHVDAPRHLFLIPAQLLERDAADAGLEPAGLTTSDPGGLHWNAFGWAHALVPPRPGKAALAARVAGGAVGRLLRPIERRDLRGATYTATFRKR